MTLRRGPFNFLPPKSQLNDPKKAAFLKTLLKKEKMLVTSIFYDSHNVLYLSQRKLQTFILSSANAFNLDWSKILSFPQELNALWEKEKLLVRFQT